jgi:hypothetical protein
MKKLLVTLTAVLVSASTFGQGTILFNNRTGNIDAPVKRADGTGAGAGVTAQLFLVTGAAGSETYTALSPTTTFRTTSPAAAFYVNQVSVGVPTVAPGQSATVVMRAWEGASYDTAVIKGQSNPVTLPALGGGSPPLPDALLNGLTTFTLVPEPSTMALGLLGAAALLYRRRK